MNEIFEKIYNDNNTSLNEDTALFEKVYTEAEMLNEMNPKLRALLAAGLIGTAGLGAASCSMPTDDPYDVQYTIEQSTPENPVTFETLGVKEYAESLARAIKDDKPESQLANILGYTDLIYKDGFVPVEFNADGKYGNEDGPIYIRYIDVSDKIVFNVPVSMESDFDAAIAAYKAAHAE